MQGGAPAHAVVRIHHDHIVLDGLLDVLRRTRQQESLSGVRADELRDVGGIGRHGGTHGVSRAEVWAPRASWELRLALGGEFMHV